MRILFAGTPQFACPALESLAGAFTLCGVLTAPDKKAGRGKKILQSKVKEKALALQLEVFDPVFIDNEVSEKIKEKCPDLLVVAAYGKIFEQKFLSLFPLGGINIHPSLLPRYRGPSPIPAAILAGDTESGVTIQRIALKMDQGDILLQKQTPLCGTETTLELTETYGRLGADAVVQVVRDIELKRIQEIPQDHEAATYCRLIKKEDGKIRWEEGADLIQRKVRAYYPWPGTYTTYHGLQLLITRSVIDISSVPDSEYKPGQVIRFDKNNGLQIMTGNGCLFITRLKLQAKREMNFKDFYNGHKDIINSILGE